MGASRASICPPAVAAKVLALRLYYMVSPVRAINRCLNQPATADGSILADNIIKFRRKSCRSEFCWSISEELRIGRGAARRGRTPPRVERARRWSDSGAATKLSPHCELLIFWSARAGKWARYSRLARCK